MPLIITLITFFAGIFLSYFVVKLKRGKTLDFVFNHIILWEVDKYFSIDDKLYVNFPPDRIILLCH